MVIPVLLYALPTKRLIRPHSLLSWSVHYIIKIMGPKGLINYVRPTRHLDAATKKAIHAVDRIPGVIAPIWWVGAGRTMKGIQ